MGVRHRISTPAPATLSLLKGGRKLNASSRGGGAFVLLCSGVLVLSGLFATLSSYFSRQQWGCRANNLLSLALLLLCE